MTHNPAILILFISSDASICSTMAFHPFGNSDHIVSVSSDFKLNASAAASDFGSRFRLELMYTSLLHSSSDQASSPWFSDACAAAIIHGNHFFRA